MRRLVPTILLVSLASATVVVGCGDPYVASRDGDGGAIGDGGTPPEDGGGTTPPKDSGSVDVGTVGDPCTSPGKSESSACGNCGTRVRVCSSSKTWSDWSTCTGEGICAAGATDSQACSGGGTQTRTCSSTCTWGSFGPCEGAPPPCGTLGKVDTQACGNCGTQSRTCGSTGWSSFGTCSGEGVCAAGATDSTSCGTGGTKTRSCDSTCAWGAYGTCIGGTTSGCAGGSAQQTFSSSTFAGMWGCAGSIGYSSGGTLCAAGMHLCSSTEFAARRGTLSPSHHYWVSDYLYGSGTEGACKASKTSTAGNFCPTATSTGGAAPMRLCASTKYDVSGNYCTWVACGYESTTASLYFGGCNDDSGGKGLKAGAVCCN